MMAPTHPFQGLDAFINELVFVGLALVFLFTVENRIKRSRMLTPFELMRYLDYCSEMLAILSKLAALHTQHFNDAVTLEAVNDVENLTQGLSRTIWQKIMILDRVHGSG